MINKYTDQQLVKEYFKQLRDEKIHPEKYDEPGDMPSYYLYEEIDRRKLAYPLPFEDETSYEFVIADWKDIDTLIKGFKRAIENIFGGKVYQLPSFKGTDTYGFLISENKLTHKEIKQIDNKIKVNG